MSLLIQMNKGIRCDVTVYSFWAISVLAYGFRGRITSLQDRKVKISR
jgi:hypothetical protein